MTAETDLLPLPEPVAYADPMAFDNFKRQGHLGGVYGREWMWAKPDAGLVAMYSAEQVAHATAAKDAEIEALRAEVERLRRDRDDCLAAREHYASLYGEQHGRAEQLEEALREARQVVRELLPDATYTKWDAALHPIAAQEDGRG